MAVSAFAITTTSNLPPFQICNFKPASSYSLLPCSCSLPSSSPDANGNQLNLKPASNKFAVKKCIFDSGIGLLAASVLAWSPLDADATRIEYYATVGEPLCEFNFAPSGLGYCDVHVGAGQEAPRGELINVHYTARFADGTVFDSSYKRARPLTMRIGVGKVIKGLDQGILGGDGVSPMHIGGKRRLQIPPHLAYGPEPAGCFSGDCNIPGNATLLYDIKFVGIYSGNAK